MAGDVGTVMNKSPFSSYMIRNWESWMTEACILHASNVSIPELAKKYGKSREHLGNIMRTDQAREIFQTISQRALKNAEGTLSDRISVAKNLAVDNIIDGLSNQELKTAKPFDFWNQSRQSLETLSRVGSPTQSVTNNNTVVQNNVLNVTQASIDKLRNAPTMQEIPSPQYHVEYLGSPPPTKEELLGRGVSKVESKGEDGPSIPLSGRPTSE